MTAVTRNGGFTASSPSGQTEAGYPVYNTPSGGYEAGPVQTGQGNGFGIKANGPLAATFHTHLAGSGLPSNSSNNAAGSSDSGDTVAAVCSHADIYVISGNGLAVTPSAKTEQEAAKNSHWVIQGPNFGVWHKALKKRCNQ